MAAEAFLSVRDLGKKYGATGWRMPWEGREAPPRWAIRGVSLELERGRILGIAGLSGSGKSTLARCLALLETPDAGEILLAGGRIWPSASRERPHLRTRVQLIIQQPAATLNPHFTAAEIIAEPLLIQKRGSRAERNRRAAELMELTGLPSNSGGKTAPEFSGGERQRLAIARALALGPELLILDESLSGLDLSVQAQIAALLQDLRHRLSLTCILISHDLELLSQITDEIAIMDAGAVVERARPAELRSNPAHARTRELVDAASALAGGDGA